MKRFFGDLRNFAGIAALAVLVAFLLGPGKGFGFALGLSSTVLNFLGLWAVIWVLKQGDLMGKKLKAWGAAILFLVSMPISVGCMVISKSISADAPGAFLCGLGMVYFWAVGWAEATKPS